MIGHNHRPSFTERAQDGKLRTGELHVRKVTLIELCHVPRRLANGEAVAGD